MPKTFTDFEEIEKISIKYRSTNSEIQKERERNHEIVSDEMKNLSINKKHEFTADGPHARLKFLNRFHVYNGFSKI